MCAEIHFEHRGGVEYGSRGVDSVIAALAERQHGVVARLQLLQLGLSRREIQGRVARGQLHPVHRGVYAVGHRRLSREGAWLAAVLAGGTTAVLSHDSAAALWGIRKGGMKPIHVTTPAHGSRAGIRFHRAELGRGDVTERKGIRVTTPERTIFDLAATLTATQLEQAIRQAEYEHLTTLATLAGRSSSCHGRRGARTMRTALARCESGKGVPRKQLERRFQRFLRRHGLPGPDLNVPMRIDGRWIEADCVWSEQRLIVELDGRDAHLNTHSFESDRQRDRALQAAGWRVIRITWRQLIEQPDEIAVHLYSLLFRS